MVVSVPARVTKGDDGYRLNGVKSFAPFANSADILICVARGPEDGGVTLCVVPADAGGVTITPMPSIAGYPQARVEFNDIEVTHEMILGKDMDGGLNPETCVGVGHAGAVRRDDGPGSEDSGDGHRLRQKPGFSSGGPSARFRQSSTSWLTCEWRWTRLNCWHIAPLAAWRRAAIARKKLRWRRRRRTKMSRMSTVAGHGVYAGISYTVEHDMQLYSARNRLAEAEGGGTFRPR